MRCSYCGSKLHTVENCPKTWGGSARRRQLHCGYCGTWGDHDTRACPKTWSGPAARRGTDLEHPVEISLEEAYQGASRTLNLQVEEPCSSCQGTGRIQNALCSVCRGAGMVPRIKRLEVKIPPGVNTGSRVRLAGKGGPGHGGPNGNLYLIITVKPHQKLERRGNDLYAEVPVPLVMALLGGEVEVPTIKGKISLKIPPETQNEQSFRLGGQGMPHLGDSRHGDLRVKVKVVLPQKLSAEEKQLFEQLRQLRPGS